jgi:thiol-disulfide isomerase/thioredoxin
MAALLGATVSTLAAGLGALSSSPARKHALLFVSGTDAETGLSWCPDCRRAQPAVERAAAAAGAALLVVEVGDKAGWKSAAHPFRTDPGLKLTCIPTLLAWDAALGAVSGA